MNKLTSLKFYIDGFRSLIFNVTRIETNQDSEFKIEENVKISVDGGGLKGQAEAIRMAISRALCKINVDFRGPLKEKKFLTRDSREVERKKFGKRKARRSSQFSKR